MDIKAKIFNGRVNAQLLQDKIHHTLDSDFFMAGVIAAAPRHNPVTKLIDVRVITTTGEVTLQNVSMLYAKGTHQGIETTCQLYAEVPKAKVSKEVMAQIDKEYHDIYDKYYDNSKYNFSEANAFGTNHVERRMREAEREAKDKNLPAIIDYINETPWHLGKVDEKLARELQDSCLINPITTVVK